MVDMHLICSPYEASPLTTDGFVLQEMMGSVTE